MKDATAPRSDPRPPNRGESETPPPSGLFEDWDDYFKNSTPLPGDFEAIMAEMREEEPPLEERTRFG